MKSGAYNWRNGESCLANTCFAYRFDQVLPKILAREEAAMAESQGTSLAPTMQAESSTPIALDAPSIAVKAPRASEWSQQDFVNLLRRYVDWLFARVVTEESRSL